MLSKRKIEVGRGNEKGWKKVCDISNGSLPGMERCIISV